MPPTVSSFKKTYILNLIIFLHPREILTSYLILLYVTWYFVWIIVTLFKCFFINNCLIYFIFMIFTFVINGSEILFQQIFLVIYIIFILKFNTYQYNTLIFYSLTTTLNILDKSYRNYIFKNYIKIKESNKEMNGFLDTIINGISIIIFKWENTVE